MRSRGQKSQWRDWLSASQVSAGLNWASFMFGCSLAAIASAASAQTLTPSSDGQTVAAETNATPSVDELVKLKQNPVSGLRQIELQATVNPGLHNSGKTSSNFSIQPVWPIALNEDWRLITYTILPVIQQPGAPGESSVAGLSDTLINLFVSPQKAGAVVWGAGPSILLPTRTNPALGSDRVALGPALVLFYPQDKWSAGVVLQNGWSLGGSGRNRVNAAGAQYILNYNLPGGWYLYSNATITADWIAKERDRWTVPVGGGAGRVFTIGKQSVSASLQALAYPVTPQNGPRWSVIGQFAFLFP